MSLKPYSVSYRHMGREYTIEVYGESEQDVRDRIRSAYHNGEPQRVYARVTVPDAIGNFLTGGR